MVLQVKKTKETVTFRVEKALLERLEKEAKKKRISLNVHANHIFEEHVNWHSTASEAGLISFPKELLIKMMKKLTDSEVEEVAEYVAKKQVKDIILLLRSKHDPDVFLDVLETWCSVYDLPYTHDINDKVHSFLVQHDMGRKWSLYLSKLFEIVFDELELKKAHFDVTDNSVAFQVDLEKPRDDS